LERAVALENRWTALTLEMRDERLDLKTDSKVNAFLCLVTG
jgi:hypothetical protein